MMHFIHFALVFLLFLTSRKAQAQEESSETQTKATEQRAGATRTEFSVGLPVLYFSSKNEKGTSSSWSVFGYFFDAAFCPTDTFCGTVASHSHVDIRSGRRVFEGTDVGFRTFLLGRVNQTNSTSSLFLAEEQSSLRSYFGAGIAQRNFDFRSVVEDNSKFVTSKPTLEGGFWSLTAHTGTDFLLLRKFRMGARLHYGKSISTSIKNFSTEHYLLDLQLIHLNF
ncbi:MAG: hypothetical protein RIR26_1797 [Pseudomonadota bacterium]|jgi:hypothetical protein